jgi:hypothetical protein
LDEPDGHVDEHQELQKLGLPVLEQVAAEVGGEEVATVRDRLFAVCRLLGVVRLRADDPLPEHGQKEEREEEDREALLVDPAPHQWCVIPMTV